MPPSSVFRLKSRRASILLSNTADYGANLKLGVHLINSALRAPQAAPPGARSIPRSCRHDGRYELDPNFALTVRADGNRLFVQATAQPEFETFAESATDFFSSRGRCPDHVRSPRQPARRRR